jgi:hypothetical protein
MLFRNEPVKKIEVRLRTNLGKAKVSKLRLRAKDRRLVGIARLDEESVPKPRCEYQQVVSVQRASDDRQVSRVFILFVNEQGHLRGDLFIVRLFSRQPTKRKPKSASAIAW